MVLAAGDYLYWIADKENKGVCVEAKTGQDDLGGAAERFRRGHGVARC